MLRAGTDPSCADATQGSYPPSPLGSLCRPTADLSLVLDQLLSLHCSSWLCTALDIPQTLILTQVAPGAPPNQQGPSLLPHHLVKLAALPVSLPTVHPVSKPETWAPLCGTSILQTCFLHPPNDVASVLPSFSPLGCSWFKPLSLPVHLGHHAQLCPFKVTNGMYHFLIKNNNTLQCFSLPTAWRLAWRPGPRPFILYPAMALSAVTPLLQDQAQNPLCH